MSGGSKKSGPSVPTEGTTLESPISAYKRLVGTYPSNTQIWWAYKRPLELGTQEPPKNYIEVFDPQLRHQIASGNSPAPKGHYILSAFRKDRSGVSNVTGLDIQTSDKFRPNSVAFFAGRVFYSGVNTAGFNTNVYFTQILERPDQIQYCYQSQDPTSEEIRDLLPSDGGVITIPEVAEINHLFIMGQALFVGASNGVWMITGSEGIGFRANDYSVSKISGVPVISSMSFVFVEGVPIWWNRSGIYTLGTGQNGQPAVQSLTETTIKTFFDEIPTTSKFYAKGAYDPLIKRVQWLYRSTEPTTESEKFRYDRILNFDTTTGGFYPFEPFPATRIENVGIFNVEGYATQEQVDVVMVGSDEVFVNTDQVLHTSQIRIPTSSVTKYIVNILGDTTDIPAPPAPGPAVVDDVFVDADPVLVNADQVQVTQVQ